MEQSLNPSADINESAEVCEPFYLTIYDLTWCEAIVDLLFLGLEFLLQDCSAGENHVVALPVHLQNLQLPYLTDKLL